MTDTSILKKKTKYIDWTRKKKMGLEVQLVTQSVWCEWNLILSAPLHGGCSENSASFYDVGPEYQKQMLMVENEPSHQYCYIFLSCDKWQQRRSLIEWHLT